MILERSWLTTIQLRMGGILFHVFPPIYLKTTYIYIHSAISTDLEKYIHDCTCIFNLALPLTLNPSY